MLVFNVLRAALIDDHEKWQLRRRAAAYCCRLSLGHAHFDLSIKRLCVEKLSRQMGHSRICRRISLTGCVSTVYVGLKSIMRSNIATCKGCFYSLGLNNRVHLSLIDNRSTEISFRNPKSGFAHLRLRYRKCTIYCNFCVYTSKRHSVPPALCSI